MMVHTIRRPSFWASRDYLHNTYCDVERVMAELASIAFNVEERTQDRIRALELLAKHGGAFVERSEIQLQAHNAIDAPPACATYADWFGQAAPSVAQGERMRESAAYV